MAEAYLRLYAGDRAAVWSAGLETHGVNPRAIAIMKEDNIDISGQTSNHVDEYRAIAFDMIITVCDNARERCPLLPSKARHFHHSFPDPAKEKGSEAGIMDSFRAVRDEIREYCRQFAETVLL